MALRPYHLTPLVFLVFLASGCSTPMRQTPTLPTLPRTRSLVESQPFTSVASVPGKLFASTAKGLRRFNYAAGFSTLLTRADGLPGDHVYGVASDANGDIWAATDGGLGRLRQDKWTPYAFPKGQVLPITTLLAVGDAVWVGSARGLTRFQVDNGEWTQLLSSARISHLLAAPAEGDVWVGTRGRGIYQYHQGEMVAHSPARGQNIRSVRGMTFDNQGHLLAVGRGRKSELLALYDGRFWTSYTVRPKGRLQWVQQVGGRTLISFGRHLLHLARTKSWSPPPEAPETPPPVGPVRLQGTRSPLAPANYPITSFYTERIDLLLPPEPTAVGVAGKNLLVATRRLGLAMYDGEKIIWYRTNDLNKDRKRLKMACGRGECFIPVSGGHAIKYTAAKGFAAARVRPGHLVHGFLKHPSGALLALHSPARDPSYLVLSRLRGERFAPIYKARISLPHKRFGVRFVRADPRGRIWAGLWCWLKTGARRPWGVVVLPPPLKPAPASQPASAPASQPASAPASRPANETADPVANEPSAPAAKDAAAQAAKDAAAPAVPAVPAAQKPSGPAAKKPAKKPAKLLPGVPTVSALLHHRVTRLPDERPSLASLPLPDDIRGIWFEGPGVFWAATNQGLRRVKGSRVERFTEADELDSDLTYGVGRSPSGDILVAGHTGLGRREAGKWTFDQPPPLNGTIRALISQGGTLWAATFEGVVRWQGKVVRTFGERDDLAGNIALDIYLEGGKRLWVLTDKGLSLVPLKK